jgi:hypothetical protein
MNNITFKPAIKLTATIVSLVALSVLAACGGEKPEEGSAKDIEGAAIKAAAGAVAGAAFGAATGMSVSTADLPDFVPIPPRSRVISNMKLNTGDKLGGNVSIETKESPDAVIAFYKAAMAAANLPIAVETITSEFAQLGGVDEKTKRNLMVMIAVEREKGVMVNLTHSRPTEAAAVKLKVKADAAAAKADAEAVAEAEAAAK